MAGLVCWLFDPLPFWGGFIISEVIACLSSFTWEGLLMGYARLVELVEPVSRIYRRAITSMGAYLPFRQSLLMSL